MGLFPTLTHGQIRKRMKDAVSAINALVDSQLEDGGIATGMDDRRRIFNERVRPAIEALADILNVPPSPAGAAAGAVPAAAPPIARPRASSFEEFVGEIGKAMVSAQQGLDVASNLYSHGGGPLVAPTSYRIPKLTASMRFALEKTDEKRFDLLIYSSSETARELNQQTLDLELVAVPAAPDLIAAIEGRRPRMTLLTGTGQRAPLLDALERGLATKPGLEAVRADPSRVVFAVGTPFRTGASAMAENVLAIFTTPDPPGADPPLAGAWFMTILDGVPQPDAAVLVPFGPAADPVPPAPPSPQKLLHNLADPLCAAQAALPVAGLT
jgi:hypothetical protein